jgi:hypothetical protein
VGDMMMFMMVVRVMGNKIIFEVHTDAGEQTHTQVGSQIDLGGDIEAHLFKISIST